MGAMTEMVEKQAVEKARGVLTGSERMKIQVLADIAESGKVSVTASEAARALLQKWEERAVNAGHASLSAWLERR